MDISAGTRVPSRATRWTLGTNRIVERLLFFASKSSIIARPTLTLIAQSLPQLLKQAGVFGLLRDALLHAAQLLEDLHDALRHCGN